MPEDSKRELTDEVRRAINRSFSSKGFDYRAEKAPARPKGPGFSLAGLFRKTDPRLIESFTRELSILLGSGVDLLGGIRLLAGRAGSPDFAKILKNIADSVEQGSSFWQALSRFPHSFPRIYVSSIMAGESSGRLEYALEELCRFYEFEIMARKKIKTILTYPAVVMTLAVIVLIILSVTILPVFKEMLGEIGAETPVVINIIYSTGAFFAGYWPVLAVVLVFILLLPSILRLFRGGEILLDRFILKLPVFGKIFLRIIISRFSRNLAILLSSGVRITEALDTCAETSGNSVVAEKLREIRNGIEKGESIESILNEPGVFPPLLVDMLVVGEQSGELEMVLNRVADVYGREAEDTISSFAAIMEPALILCMGALVAFVFTSLFLPYLDILTAMGGAAGF